MAAWQIPLQVKSPDLAGPAQIEQQALSAQHLITGNQVQNEQLRAAQMANQEHEAQIADQQLIRKAYMEGDGYLPQVIKIAAQSGVAPKNLLPLQQAHLNLQKTLAQTNREMLPVMQYNSERHAGAVDAFIQRWGDSPEPEKRAAWTQQLQQEIQSGTITPQDAQGLVNYDLSKDSLEGMKKGLIGYSKAIADHRSEAQAADFQARANKLTAEVGDAKAKTILGQVDVAAGQLRTAAAQSPQAYNELRSSLPAGVADFFKRAPAGDKWQDDDSRDQFVSDINVSAMKPAQRNAAEARDAAADAKANQEAKPTIKTTLDGTYAIYPGAPGEDPVVKPITAPGGKPIKQQPIGGTSAERQERAAKEKQFQSEVQEEMGILEDVNRIKTDLKSGATKKKDGSNETMSDSAKEEAENNLDLKLKRLADIYANRIKLGYVTDRASVGFPETKEQADTIEKGAKDNISILQKLLAVKEGTSVPNPWDPKGPEITMKPELKRNLESAVRAEKQKLVFAQTGRRTIGTGQEDKSDTSSSRTSQTSPREAVDANGRIVIWDSRRRAWVDKQTNQPIR